MDKEMHHLGCIGLLAELSVHATDEDRDLIVEAIEDAKQFFPNLKVRRILNRIEVDTLVNE